jgi:hypothetical protein
MGRPRFVFEGGARGVWEMTHGSTRAAILIVLALVVRSSAAQEKSEQDQPATLPTLQFHLTARPWQPIGTPRDAYLDVLEGVCRFTAKQLDKDGAVIDPFLHREHQYSTPYFAFGVATLAHAGRAPDLLPAGIRAMDHATLCFVKGKAGIPDHHGEFFLGSLPGALELFEGHVPVQKLAVWRVRLKTPAEQVLHGDTNNWRTYAMRGEFLRAKLGLVDRLEALKFCDDSWLKTSQQDRMAKDKWNLYQDRKTDPDSHAVEAVGRVNLLGLLDAGFDGASREEMQKLVERATTVSLLLTDPSGQCPPGGRTADHVFNDVLYQLAFEVMAERAHAAGDEQLAGQFRHAALASFQSIARWRRDDGDWAGSFYITKNHFPPAERVGYQTASNYGNYNGAVMQHLGEAYLSRHSEIVEQPSPAEIGGYAFSTDPKFASAVADAGGMQLFAALRGDTEVKYDHYWTTLGVVRMGRVNWDTRLGPSDGVRDAKSGRGVSFAPTWEEQGSWVRMADVPDRHHGEFSVQFVHPLLVRCAIDYKPKKGAAGPHFRHEFLITPDGILAMLKSDDAKNFGVTWPLLENDGAALKTEVKNQIATTGFKNDGDQQSFIALNSQSPLTSEDAVQSAYGWLRPIRAAANDGAQQTFVYPRNASDPSAADVAKKLRFTADGFESSVGSVHGNFYVGRTSAGGEGTSIDLNGDGQPDATFSQPCKFVLQLNAGEITAVEADKAVDVKIGERTISLKPFTPVVIPAK